MEPIFFESPAEWRAWLEADHAWVGIAVEELDEPRTGGGQVDVGVGALSERRDEVDAEGRRSRLLELLDPRR